MGTPVKLAKYVFWDTYRTTEYSIEFSMNASIYRFYENEGIIIDFIEINNFTFSISIL